jgi:hypothetical protein
MSGINVPCVQHRCDGREASSSSHSRKTELLRHAQAARPSEESAVAAAAGARKDVAEGVIHFLRARGRLFPGVRAVHARAAAARHLRDALVWGRGAFLGSSPFAAKATRSIRTTSNPLR